MADMTKVIAAMNKGRKAPIAAQLSAGIRSDITNVIPTGIDVLDNYVIGVGGLPCGRMVEIYSQEGVGKTSLALGIMAAAQRNNSLVFLAETECALEASRPATFGVDWDQVALLEPGHWGEVMDVAEAALMAMPKKETGLFVLDSVAATLSREEAEEGLTGKEGFDKRPKAIGAFVRRLSPLLAEKQVAVLFINQVRDNVGVMYGADLKTPGGHAIKFHSSMRLHMRNGKAIKGVGGVHLGKFVSIIAEKNKFRPPWRKAKLKLDFEKGWDDEWSTLTHAKEMKLVPPRSQDVSAARELLEQNNWTRSAGTQEAEDEQTE